MWCPGCLAHYQDTLDPPYRMEHATEFLAEHLDRLRFTYPVPKRVALHYHTGRPQTEREAACAQQLLRAVPGLELVDVGSDPRLGRSCTGGVLRELGPQGWEALATAQMERAASLGVEVFATLYHSCHRFLAGYQGRYPFAVEHYLSLVGQALGIEHEDRFRKYLLWGDAERILEDAAPCLEANGVAPVTARSLVERVFVRGELG